MVRKTRKSKVEREAIEPQLAATMLYYDSIEFDIFLDLFREIESDPELTPTGQFIVFINHLVVIHKTAKNNGREVSHNDVISQIEALNNLEPNEANRARFQIWFENVKSLVGTAAFELSEDLYYHYIWLYNMDKMNLVNNSDLAFEDKLNFKILKPSLPLNGGKNSTFLTLDNEEEDEDVRKRYTTGIDILDNYIEPVDSNFFVIAARPGVGKSVTMLQMGLENALQGIPSLFISLEMTLSQLKSRILNWYKDEYTPYTKYKEVSKEMRFQKLIKNFIITANKGNNADTIFSIMEEAIEKYGTKIFFLDYLQLVRYTGCTEWESLRNLTFDLKQFAKKNNVLVVSCTQVSRDSTNYGLELTSLFGSSTIENDSDIVIGLERIERDNIDDSSEKEINIKVLKNRQGLSGNKLNFDIDYATMKFKSK